jgi:sirohydrochlorin cobaltochelatase
MKHSFCFLQAAEKADNSASLQHLAGNHDMPSLDQLRSNTGVIICGHGSRAKLAEEEFSLLAAGLRARYPHLKIEYGFLEYSSPNIHMALDSLLKQGVDQIYAVPGMLFLATHAKNDIPSVLTTYREAHPGLAIEYGNELGLHDEMIAAFEARILEALGYSETPAFGELYDTMLVVVGRGTSVAGANAEAAKLTRIVCENLGFGWSETVYSGVTFPSVGRGLEMALKLGFKKIVVAPYFLFGGRLIDRIYAYVDKVAEENPEIEFVKADYLRDQTHVINTFIARIEETVSGDRSKIGLMQDFEARLARGEVDVHHHHAEFQPETEPAVDTAAESPNHDHSHGHTHSHSHGHGHGHHHAPYRHIAHPLGPRTMINENVCCCFMSQFPQSVIDEEKAVKPEVDRIPQCQRSRQK